MTSKRERLEAAIAGERADRSPVALWRHFPVDDQDPLALAEAHLEFQALHDFDLMKITPASSFSVKDWGVEDAWKGDPEGTRDYTRYVVKEPRDWARLRPRRADRGYLASQVKCLGILRDRVGLDVPYLQTIFSPLTQAKHLAGEARLMEHLRRDPAAVEAGLETITRTTLAFLDAARACGIAGVFYAAQQATYRLMDRAGYARFGEPYDRRLLEAASGLWLNMLHLHGEAVMFDVAISYPVQVINWHDRETAPSLGEARRLTRIALCGGLRRWETMVLGTPDAVRAEAAEALRATGGRGLVLGTGCVVPVLAPRANLRAARSSA
jgi:uroporphyrinogen decarboxylase